MYITFEFNRFECVFYFIFIQDRNSTLTKSKCICVLSFILEI